MSETLDDLRAELDALKARVDQLEPKRPTRSSEHCFVLDFDSHGDRCCWCNQSLPRHIAWNWACIPHPIEGHGPYRKPANE